MNELDKPAFPHVNYENGQGFTKRETACLVLRIPETGNAELDAFITKAQRQEFVKQAMEGILANPALGMASEFVTPGVPVTSAVVATLAEEFAKVTLKRLEEKK